MVDTSDNSGSYYDIVLQVFDKVRNHLPTLSANQYNYYKQTHMPVAQTLSKHTGKSWDEIISYIGLPRPLNRQTLACLSYSLHFLEKRIKKVLGIGWQEKNFYVDGKQFRPDSYCIERFFIEDDRFFILDVKLCVSAASITIYKYLPIFENPPAPSKDQLTFFPDWFPKSAFNEEPLLHYDIEGQMSMILKNNILYICYLIGTPQDDEIPYSSISGSSSDKVKRLPKDMEVRYVHFRNMPELYCNMAGIDYGANVLAPLMDYVDRIEDIVLSLPEDADAKSIEISERIKREF